MSESEARAKFGFLLDALSFGAPPGTAASLSGSTGSPCSCAGADHDPRRHRVPRRRSSAVCLMTEAPSPVDARQLRELGLKLNV